MAESSACKVALLNSWDGVCCADLVRLEFGMFSRVMGAFFGCIHANYSFPRTLKPVRNSRGVPSKPRTYVVCLDCGKDLPYDWDNMKLISEENRAA